MKKIILFLVFLSLNLLSQVTQEWVTNYNGPGNGNDNGPFIALDNDGNIIIAGSSAGNESTFDIAALKYNSLGSLIWAKRFNGAGNGDDNPYAILVDDFSNVYIAGRTFAGPASLYDIVVIKYNQNGDQLWVKIFNGQGSGIDAANSIEMDNRGNIYVSGFTYVGAGQNYNSILIKYSPSGDLKWALTDAISSGHLTASYGLRFDKEDGNAVYVTGYGDNGNNTDIFVVKYDTLGAKQWFKTYNGPANGDEESYSIALDRRGNPIVTGFSEGSGSGEDLITIKYDPLGNQKWASRYNGPGNSTDVGKSIIADTFAYATGYSEGSGTGEDIITVKYDSLGTQLWSKRYNGNGNGNDRGMSIALDNSGNIYVGGFSDDVIYAEDFAAVSYNCTGHEIWDARYNGPGNSDDRANNIAVRDNFDYAGKIYVCGFSTGVGSGQDITLIGYSQIIGIKKISGEVPVEYTLFQNYPNPFNPSTKIKFALPPSPKVDWLGVRMIIYDILGREVATLVNERLFPGTYEVEWDGSSFASGLYFYTIKTESYRETKKMLMIK